MVKVGDKVRFLNDVGGGVVTRISGKNMVLVENQDGFEIPTMVSQLVVVGQAPETYDNSHQAKEPAKAAAPVVKTPKKAVFIDGKDHPDFYLAFVPQNESNPVGGDIEAWLVNDSNFKLLVHFSHLSKGIYKTQKSGTAAPNSTQLLESFGQHDLAELPEFCFQILYFSEENNQLFPPVLKKLKVNPVKFYREKTFEKTAFFKQKAWLLAISANFQEIELDKLSDDDLKKIVAQKEEEANPQAEPLAKKKEPGLVEVDLHIQELVESFSGLENHEILEIQINKFRSEMDAAIKNRVKRIVFIHGVGQGTLKAELIKELKSRYRKYYFQDASFKEYGYGATMVVLQR